MTYKNTLTLYNELKATGISEEQAQIQAAQLGGMGEHFSQSLDSFNSKLNQTLDSFNSKLNQIDLKLKDIEKDLIWMRIIGGAMTFAFLSAAVWGK